MTAGKKRIRRTPEEAWEHILDAAEAIMAEGQGPAALRLQDVARRAEVSHPTILHHFKSREGLVRALNKRAFERLSATAIGAMAAKSGVDGIATSFETFRNGLAQRLIWLMQSSNQPPPGRGDLFDQVVDAFQNMRRQFVKQGSEPDPAVTRAIIHLTTVAAFGDALIGARLRQAGNREAGERARFEKWFAELLDVYLTTPAPKGKK